MKKLTDREYVLRAADLKGLIIWKPTRANPGITGYLQQNGFYKQVLDAKNWAEARTQINNYYN